MAGKQPVAIVFDTFGTVVDWRSSLIADLTASAPAAASPPTGPRWSMPGAPPTTPRWTASARASCPGPSSMRCTGPRSTRWSSEFGIKGLSEEDLVHINLGWHRLHPWPDSVPGLTRLKSRFIIGPLSNGNVSLLLNMAKFAGIPWDMIFGSDLFGHFKPDPETYLGVAKMLDLRPDQVMMAAAHNGDLAAARACGLLTAFFPRPGEYGPHQKRDYAADQDWDVVATDIQDMAAKLGV